MLQAQLATEVFECVFLGRPSLAAALRRFGVSSLSSPCGDQSLPEKAQ